MTERQRRWLEIVVFLNRVNIETLRRMHDDDREVREVFDWFQREGSLRDVTTDHPCVREYVRSRLADYLLRRDPERCRELRGRAGEYAPCQ